MSQTDPQTKEKAPRSAATERDANQMMQVKNITEPLRSQAHEISNDLCDAVTNLKQVSLVLHALSDTIENETVCAYNNDDPDEVQHIARCFLELSSTLTATIDLSLHTMDDTTKLIQKSVDDTFKISCYLRTIEK